MAERPRTRERVYQVFLSHSHHDEWIAGVMKEKLEAAGVKVWLDVADVPGGANIRERIRQGIKASAECLILLSPESRKSDWVKHEGGMADLRGLVTTFVLLHVDRDAIPAPFREELHLSINAFDEYLAQVVARQRIAGLGGRK